MEYDKKQFEDGQKKSKELSSEILLNLNRKDYLITGYIVPDYGMSLGNPDMMESPRQFYKPVNLFEIQDYITMMSDGFWTHPDINKKDEDDIPYNERKFGRYRKIIVEPLSEELEKRYLDRVDKDFFKIQREYLQTKNSTKIEESV